MTPNKGIDTPNTLSRQMESLKTRKFLAPSDYLSYKKIGTQLNNFSLINKFLSFVLEKKEAMKSFLAWAES